MLNAASHPRGLRRLILASALVSKDLSIHGIQLLRKQLSLETQQALKEKWHKGHFNDPACKDTMNLFFKKHLCRVEPFLPEELIQTLRHLTEDKIVYGTVYIKSAYSSASLLSYIGILYAFQSERRCCLTLSLHRLCLVLLSLPLITFPFTHTLLI